MDPGIAPCAAGQTAAGQPAVFSSGVGSVVQPNLEALDQPVLVPDGNEKALRTGERPVPVIGTEAGQSHQVMPTGPEQTGDELPALLRLRHTAVLVALDARLGQAPFQQIIFVLRQQRQVL